MTRPNLCDIAYTIVIAPIIVFGLIGGIKFLGDYWGIGKESPGLNPLALLFVNPIVILFIIAVVSLCLVVGLYFKRQVFSYALIVGGLLLISITIGINSARFGYSIVTTVVVASMILALISSYVLNARLMRGFGAIRATVIGLVPYIALPLLIGALWTGVATLYGLGGSYYLVIMIGSVVLLCALCSFCDYCNKITISISFPYFLVIYFMSTFIVLAELMAFNALVHEWAVAAPFWKMIIQLCITLPLLAMGLVVEEKWIKYGLMVGTFSCILLTPTVGAMRIKDLNMLFIYFILLVIVGYLLEGRNKSWRQAIIELTTVAITLSCLTAIISMSIVTLIYWFPWWGHGWA